MVKMKKILYIVIPIIYFLIINYVEGITPFEPAKTIASYIFLIMVWTIMFYVSSDIEFSKSHFYLFTIILLVIYGLLIFIFPTLLGSLSLNGSVFVNLTPYHFSFIFSFYLGNLLNYFFKNFKK